MPLFHADLRITALPRGTISPSPSGRGRRLRFEPERHHRQRLLQQCGRCKAADNSTESTKRKIRRAAMTPLAQGQSDGVGRRASRRRYSAADFSNNIFHELWNNTQDDQDSRCAYTKFNRPLIANGKVFLPTFQGRVIVYGILDQKGLFERANRTKSKQKDVSGDPVFCSPLLLP